MKLDKYDIALANITSNITSRAETHPVLQNVSLENGNLVVTDGLMLVARDADMLPEERENKALLPAKMLKTIKLRDKQQAELSVTTDGNIEVRYQYSNGKPAEFEPTLRFKPDPIKEAYPDIRKLFPEDITKTTQIAINVKLLRKLLTCLPNDGILYLGITAPDQSLEFEVSNMKRPIRGLIMPIRADWAHFKWHREPKVKKEKL